MRPGAWRDGSDRHGVLEIIKGVVSEVKPDFVVTIDALAARSTKRLGCTIQLTDTGIVPEAG